ncbi:MAG: M20/M25/M40 family metallo-hydrolase [Bdellovibrionaceae bacterium]|nr:M20/M25/M40 family metallo-hydrolase [Bdellovibrionales bacterium]MCB9254355.1 M20/M25/M40 family metallo-hydrolase [Pseudobdellovibrionaceae bacterium]
MDIEKVIRFAETNFKSNVEKLKALARIPSVSFNGFPPEEVNKSAQAVASLLTEEGLEHVEILKLEGAHPYVYGDWLHAKGKPTLLLYAHHDVQPPGREEKWKTPPFVPTEVGDRLYGRGAADDKAGIIVHTSAIAAYLKTLGSLPVNVKVIIEGEEEIGSDHLEAFLERYKEKLQADIIVLTDTENFDVGVPAITTSLRGLVAAEVEVTVMESPKHSGMAGGPLADPVLALSKMLAALVDDNGRIAIPGIYDSVRPPSAVEKESYDSLDFTESEYRKRVKLHDSVELIGGKESIPEKLWRLPSLSVNAIQASSRKLVSNVVCESAWCKVGIRIVPDMDPQKTGEALSNFLKEKAPWGVEVKVTLEQSASWWATTPEGPAFEKARSALSKAFGRECVYVGQGGTIPFVQPFSTVLGGAPALLIGVEDPYTNAHSENESVHLGDLKKSINGAIYLYESLAE